MTNFIFANDVNTSLAGPILSGATTLTLASTNGLPSSIPSGYVLVITLRDQATRQNTEIIYASSISGATLSGLQRGQEGTSALSWLTGDYVYSGPTSGQMSNMAQISQFKSQLLISNTTTTTASVTFNYTPITNGNLVISVQGGSSGASVPLVYSISGFTPSASYQNETLNGQLACYSAEGPLIAGTSYSITITQTAGVGVTANNLVAQFIFLPG